MGFPNLISVHSLMLQSFTFSAPVSGRKLLVLGAVHGNEKCGTQAILRIVKEFEDGQLKLSQGSVTFVPICNPKAYEADTRYIDRNLNRFLVPQEKPDCYEAQIGNVLCPLLEKCDVLLDLHSYSVGGEPFVFVGNPYTAEHDFANCLGAAAGLTGWQAAYAASGRENVDVDPEEATGTTEYARRFGVRAVTLECGQHKDPLASEIAYQAIRRALNFLQLASLSVTSTAKLAKLVEVKKVFYRDDERSVFTKQWKHLDWVAGGEIVASNPQGGQIAVPADGYIILPHFDAPCGAEWFYWGQERQRDGE